MNSVSVIEVNTIYEDKDVLVLNKPAGLLVHPTGKGEKGTLVDWLLEKYPEIKGIDDNCRGGPCGRLKTGIKPETSIRSVSTKIKFYRPGIVHRLDKNTSGLMIVAKNQRAFDWLKRQFQQRRVVKKYFALVYDQVKSRKGSIVRSIGRTKRDFRKKAVGDFLRGKRAKTKYKVLKYYCLSPKGGLQEAGHSEITGDLAFCLPTGTVARDNRKSSEQPLVKLGTSSELYRHSRKSSELDAVSGCSELYTLLEVQPETGRTHQIRVHLKSIGHPIVGDPLYKFKRQIPLPGLRRQFLHAYYLKLRLLSGETKIFKIDLAKDLSKVFKCQNSNVKCQNCN